MKDQIAWHVELTVRPAQLDAFRKLTAEMIEFAATETGVLAYERFVSEDGASVHVYERYENSAAAIAHLRNFEGRFADRFSTMVDRKRFTVFGVPNPELRALLDRFGVVYLALFRTDRA